MEQQGLELLGFLSGKIATVAAVNAAAEVVAIPINIDFFIIREYSRCRSHLL